MRNLKESFTMKSFIKKKLDKVLKKSFCLFLAFKNNYFYFKLAKLKMNGA